MGLIENQPSVRMAVIFFVALNPKHECLKLSYGGPSIEFCFETITTLVNQGWQLINIELLDNGHKQILPAEAFDGISMIEPLQKVVQELEYVLYTSSQ